MEQLLLSLPPFLELDGEKVWLTITATAMENHWYALYQLTNGDGANNLWAEGATPSEALNGLVVILNLMSLLNAPSGDAEG